MSGLSLGLSLGLNAGQAGGGAVVIPPVDLTAGTASLRFPENNHETSFAGTFGALYQPCSAGLFANSPSGGMFVGDGSFFAVVRIPLDRMHDNRRYCIFGNSTLTAARTFSIGYYGSDVATSGNRGRIVAMTRGTSTTINVLSGVLTEPSVLIVFKRKTNAGPSVDFNVDIYNLSDATKIAGTAQTGVTMAGMTTYNNSSASNFGVGIGYSSSSLPASGSQLIARTLGAFPGEIQAFGYVAADIADATWQSIALGADILTTLGAANLQYLRVYDPTTATFIKPAGATSDATASLTSVDGSNLKPGSTLRRQDSTNYLTIDYIRAGQVFALTPGSTSRTVSFSGKAGGYTGNVEVQLVYAATGVVHTNWTTCGSISAGAWSGSFTANKSSNGWLIARARPASTPSVIAEMREPFGIGWKFGILGQSQMAITSDALNRNDQVTTPFRLSINAEFEYQQVAKKEKLFRIGPHPGSDGVVYFSKQWDQYNDNTPVMLVFFAENGTSAVAWADDSEGTRLWSSTTTIVNYLGGDFSALIWQWGTTDFTYSATYSAQVLDAVINGTGAYVKNHYVKDGLTFTPGFGFIMSQLTRHSQSLVGPFNTDQYGTAGTVRDAQIAWAAANSHKIGPSCSDLNIASNDGPHQDLTAINGDPLLGVRLAMTAARAVNVDTSTDPTVAGATLNGPKTAITVTFNLPNGGSLKTNGQDADVRGFEVSDDGGSTYSRATFTGARSSNTVVLTKTSGSWTGGGTTKLRFNYGGPNSYGSADTQSTALAGMLYESYALDLLGYGLPVMGSNTAMTVT